MTMNTMRMLMITHSFEYMQPHIKRVLRNSLLCVEVSWTGTVIPGGHMSRLRQLRTVKIIEYIILCQE